MSTDGAFPPAVVLSYPADMSVLFDAHYLIECTLLGLHLSAEELSNARFFLKFVLPNLLCINVLQDAQVMSGVLLENEDAQKMPISYATQLNVPDFSRYIRSFLPSDTSAVSCVPFGPNSLCSCSKRRPGPRSCGGVSTTAATTLCCSCDCTTSSASG